MDPSHTRGVYLPQGHTHTRINRRTSLPSPVWSCVCTRRSTKSRRKQLLKLAAAPWGCTLLGWWGVLPGAPAAAAPLRHSPSCTRRLCRPLTRVWRVAFDARARLDLLAMCSPQRKPRRASSTGRRSSSPSSTSSWTGRIPPGVARRRRHCQSAASLSPAPMKQTHRSKANRSSSIDRRWTRN